MTELTLVISFKYFFMKNVFKLVYLKDNLVRIISKLMFDEYLKLNVSVENNLIGN